jgi:DNA invertase Pin-like site-specific DNA recombinase
VHIAFWNTLFHYAFDAKEHWESTMSKIVGYARTSTIEQAAGIEAQKRDLAAAGVTKLFSEQVSSVAPREELKRALDYLRDGDTFVVTKLDRLARSVADLVEITKAVDARGAALRILELNLDTTKPTGKLMINLLGSIAQFERELMLERQREGIAKAKREGKYRGRAPTARMKRTDVLDLHNAGIGPVEIARRLGIGRTSVYRILGAG